MIISWSSDYQWMIICRLFDDNEMFIIRSPSVQYLVTNWWISDDYLLIICRSSDNTLLRFLITIWWLLVDHLIIINRLSSYYRQMITRGSYDNKEIIKRLSSNNQQVIFLQSSYEHQTNKQTTNKQSNKQANK